MLFFKSIKKSLLVISLAFIAVGYFLYVKKVASLDYILYILGAGLVVASLISIIRYRSLKINESYGRNDFLYGLIYGTLAILTFIFRNQVKGIIAIVLGILIILSAAIKIQDMIDAKKCGSTLAGLYITLMIIAIAAGVLVIIDPFNIETFYIFTGASMMFCGITDILSNIYVAIKKTIFEGKRIKQEKQKVKEDLKAEQERKEELEALKLEKIKRDLESKSQQEDNSEAKFTRIDL